MSDSGEMVDQNLRSTIVIRLIESLSARGDQDPEYLKALSDTLLGEVDRLVPELEERLVTAARKAVEASTH